MSLIVERLGWIYANIKIQPRSGNVYCSGILTFNSDGSLRGESWGKSLIGHLDDRNDTNTIKRLILKSIQGDLERTAGFRYEIDLEKILLVDEKTYEKVARKVGSSYYRDVDQFKNVRRPLTIYFSPFRSASTGKVRSKHTLVIDVDGKVVADWTDPRGWVIGFIQKPLTNPRALKMAREFLESNGLVLGKKDRIHRLNPQTMRNKLAQFKVSEDSS